MAPFSVNNRLIVEAYVKGALRSSVSNGFAMIEQKVALKGLAVLVQAKLPDGTIVPQGSVAYIKEELLHTQPWATKAYECETLKGKFMIVDLAHVEFISPPSGDVA